MKRIIICSDGTWNRPGIKDRGKVVESNVQIMFKCIPESATDKSGQVIKQSKAYDSGVGSSTYDVRDKILGGISGAGIDKNIKDLYTFLVMNYKKGDELFLFGFSRGAYTARSLAGLIRNSGVLKPENLSLINRAYELYRDRNDYTDPDSDLMVSFKNNYCAELVTPIKFIGVWDTVGSLGIPLSWIKKNNFERYKFHDVKLSSTVENAFHALAIDERRKLFEPSLWELSDKAVNGKVEGQTMEQRWFAGVHCNVGGGYVDRGLSDLALLWLMNKATQAGLAYDNNSEEYKNIKGNYAGELRNSLEWYYRLWSPVWRKIKNGKNTNEVIDDSVTQRVADKKLNYKPGNLKTNA